MVSLPCWQEKDITLRLASYLMDSQGIPDSISRASRYGMPVLQITSAVTSKGAGWLQLLV